MFGIGIPELAIILVLALIVVGPQKLPEIARSLGKGLAAFKNQAEDLQRTFREQTAVETHKEGVQEKEVEKSSLRESEASSGEKKDAVKG